MCFGVGTVENDGQDIQANMAAGDASFYAIKALATIREDQSSAASVCEELPHNAIPRSLRRVSEPPAVLEDPRGFPTPDFAGNVHANVVMVLNHRAAYAAVNVHAGTEPCPNFSGSVSMAQTRDGGCGMWRSNVTS